MKIAVTGGAGYIGSTLIKYLIENGFEVISVDNLSIGNYDHIKNLSNKKLKLFKGDIREKKCLEKAFENVDAIAHLAAIPGLDLCNQKPEEAISTNVYGTYQVLEVAKEKKVKVVFCSSAAVYGIPKIMPVTENNGLQPLNLYGITKLAGEKILESYSDNYNLETISLRFGNVYGVGLFSNWDTVIPKFVNQALMGKPLTIFGDGHNSRDFIHVEDICQAIFLALTKKINGNEVFNVGNETCTINSIANIVRKEVMDVIGKNTEIIYIKPREGETKEFSYDLTKIKNNLNFKPKWTIKEGIKQIIKYKISSPATDRDRGPRQVHES